MSDSALNPDTSYNCEFESRLLHHRNIKDLQEIVSAFFLFVRVVKMGLPWLWWGWEWHNKL